ncbi:unnamed protein product [Prunus armeniaca]|uniref:DEAD/DEAH-box helicase domain-containing protein n=1 Tax=Prunus armeniaca TaxID=36596 RepID=A0A6J5VEP3_PRUAR|nr:unnamed protein product [Prunus armeniaca]
MNWDDLLQDSCCSDVDDFKGNVKVNRGELRSEYGGGDPELTPIHKACFPAAAHQGKDIVGAVETGAGKKLAFGLPILQFLLEGGENTM